MNIFPNIPENRDYIDLKPISTGDTFGEMLAGALKKMNMTQAEFARILGIPRSQLSNWKKKDIHPHQKTIDKIKAELGEVSIQYDHILNTWFCYDLTGIDLKNDIFFVRNAADGEDRVLTIDAGMLAGDSNSIDDRMVDDVKDPADRFLMLKHLLSTYFVSISKVTLGASEVKINKDKLDKYVDELKKALDHVSALMKFEKKVMNDSDFKKAMKAARLSELEDFDSLGDKEKDSQ